MSAYAIPCYRLHDHTVTVPLDWSRPEGEAIRVFVREVRSACPGARDLPVLLYLQGGPGGKAPRPSGGPAWLNVALRHFRVLLMDQRGTGRSSPVQGRRMAAFGSGAEAAGYLACFRADSIVLDAEHIRRVLYDDQKWCTLGQSYGGFLTLTYLSTAPEGLKGCYITGGIPGIDASAHDVYSRTFPRVAHKNQLYFQRFPQDRALLDRLADHLAENDIRLPDNDRLTVRRLQHLGLDLGMSGGFETIHWLLDEAFCDDGRLSDGFLGAVRDATSYDQNPLFAAIHESIYAQHGAVTAWSAQAVQSGLPEFSSDTRPLLFSGEMVFPWMFDEIRALRPFAAGAEALANMPLDPMLYDPGRLRSNEVPVTAAVWTDDMYVDCDLSLKTARALGNSRLWISNEFEHNGLRASPRVIERLFAMDDELEGRNFT